MTLTQEKQPHIMLMVQKEKIDSYTTLLQSGILLESSIGQPIGVFIDSLPGFDMDYIVNRIQTIFLDGNALDDMKTVFSRTTPVLALSAAMPGLAGAIFRKNSLHAALRTSGMKENITDNAGEKIFVSLKLFNMIAIEKGPAILQQGGIFSGRNLLDFFLQRPSLKQNIEHIELNNEAIAAEPFWNQLVPEIQYHIMITSHKDTQ